MAIDPICGMTVDQTTARRVERDGTTVYFCSEHCRQKFLAGAGKTGSEPSAHAPARHGAAPKAQRTAGGRFIDGHAAYGVNRHHQ